MDVAALDQVRLNFNPQGLFIINLAIGRHDAWCGHGTEN